MSTIRERVENAGEAVGKASLFERLRNGLMGLVS